MRPPSKQRRKSSPNCEAPSARKRVKRFSESISSRTKGLVIPRSEAARNLLFSRHAPTAGALRDPRFWVAQRFQRCDSERCKNGGFSSHSNFLQLSYCTGAPLARQVAAFPSLED